MAPAVFASGTTAWEMNSYSDFVRGRFDGISLSREGRLSLAPKVDTVFTSDQPVIWSVAQAPDGTLYAATGHRGRVYRIDRAGKSSLLGPPSSPKSSPSPWITHGAVYAGTSPDGKVYRIENGKATEYFAPRPATSGRWPSAPDGALYVGTGDQGKIFRVDRAGQGRAVLRHRPVAHHRPGRGFAGPPAGRHRAQRHPLPHFRQGQGLRALRCQPAGDPRHRSHAGWHGVRRRAGRVGGQARGSAAQAAQAAAGSRQWLPPPPPPSRWKPRPARAARSSPPKPKPQPRRPLPPRPQVSTQFTPVVDVSGVEKSAVYRINPDNTVETLWSSKEENVYDLLALEKQILFSTDENGRIYGLSPDRRVTLVTADQRRRDHPPAALRPFRAGRHRQHGPHLPPGREARRRPALTKRRCTIPAPPRAGAA